MCSDRYKPTTVQCHNVGSDGADAQWRCEAELDSDVAFDTVEVSCEGYYAPEDEYVLKGSCGLEYSLKFTNAYKDRQAEARRKGQSYVRPTTTTTTTTTQSEDDDGGLFKFFLLCAVGILLFAWVTRGRRQHRPLQTAPPMNDFVPPSSYTAPPSADTGPGFGAGVAVGAIGGAAAAHLLNRHTQQPTTTLPTSRFTEPTYESSYEPRRSNTSSYDYTDYSSPTRDSPPTTHKSTGYGGSKKR